MLGTRSLLTALTYEEVLWAASTFALGLPTFRARCASARGAHAIFVPQWESALTCFSLQIISIGP